MYLNNRCLQPYNHWIAVCGAFLLIMQAGLIIGWNAPNVAKFSSNVTEIRLNKDEISWVVSLAPLGGIIGTLIGAICVELFGSKSCIIMSFAFFGVTWSCMIVATTVVWLYTAQFVAGIAKISAFSSFGIFLGEIANPQIRGTFITIAMIGHPFGILVGTILETYLSMKVSSSVYLSLCILAFLMFCWLKDTPYHLVRINEHERAELSLKFYHPNANINDELEIIKNFIRKRESVGKNFWNKFNDLKSSQGVKRSLFLIAALFSLPYLNGYGSIVSYMDVIFKRARSDLIESERFVIYANVASLVTMLLTHKLIDIVGRRVLLVISSLGTTVALISLGVHFYFINNERSFIDPVSLRWLPVISIFVYLVTDVIGFSPVPSAVLSELCQDNVKSIAVFLANFISSFCLFGVTKTYPLLVDYLGESCVFWIYAALSFIVIPFALFLLPETKGKTFQEIQSVLIKEKKNYHR